MAYGKRAQSGAAILVSLIAALIIMYVLFLPPQERAQLLGETKPGGPGTPGSPGSPVVSNILFSSSVGGVYLPVAPQQRHEIPTIGIRAIEEGSILLSRDSLIVANNAFEKQPSKLLFSANPSQTRNAVLSMNLAAKTGGNVIVSLNGEQIFNQQVSTRSIPPITLSNLAQDNVIEFSASSVGFAFWSTNRYTLTTVKVTADVTDLSGASSRQGFSIADEEYASLESAQLSFVPVCDREGVITITLNGLDVFSGIPDCNNLNTLEIAPNKFDAGANSITFSTADAQVIIDRPAVITHSKKQENRAFNFNLEQSQVQGRQIGLRILFPDTSDHKGIIRLNGNTIPLRAQDLMLIPVTNYVRLGPNTIQFEALDKDFEIVKFDVLTQ